MAAGAGQRPCAAAGAAGTAAPTFADAAAWELLAGGCANRVFRYVGGDAALAGRVLRVRRPGPWPAAADATAAALEAELWADLPAAAAAGGLAAAACQAAFAAEVMGPLVGAARVPPQAPARLAGAAAAALGRPDGVLMPDATLLPALDGEPAGATICIEIKPKSGADARCATAHPGRAAAAAGRARFALRQLLKLARGEVAAPSGYAPAELFSDEPRRVAAALAALMASPQNNLGLFVDGRAVAIAGGGAPAAAALDAAAAALGAAAGDGTPAAPRAALAALLAAALAQEGALAGVRAAQAACGHDVEGVYRLYRSLVNLPVEAEPADAAHAQGPGPDAAHAAAVAALLARPRADALRVLRSYLISATAKDCALMVALRRALPGAAPRAQANFAAAGVVACAAAGGAFRYRVAVVDLDLKPLAKVAAHRRLDAELAAAAAAADRAAAHDRIG
jgi:inositol-pentakisphosphate 2-kinase